MTLHYKQTPTQIDDAQVHAVQSAGGRLIGEFAWRGNLGWELTLKELSFQELLSVIEAAKQVTR